MVKDLRLAISVGVTASVVLGLAMPAAAASRKGAEQTIDAMVACKSIADPTARLACYDNNISSLKTQRAEAIESLAAAPELVRQPFKEIDSKVQSIIDLSGGYWVVVLADKSLWRTTDVLRLDPRVGDAVHIKKGALGSFLAEIGDQQAVHVHRMQ